MYANELCLQNYNSNSASIFWIVVLVGGKHNCDYILHNIIFLCNVCVSIAHSGRWQYLCLISVTCLKQMEAQVQNALQLCSGATAATSISNNRRLLCQLQVLPLDGAVLETEWTAVPLPITAGFYPRSAVIGNSLQFLTFDLDQDDLPKMLVSIKSCLVRSSASCMQGAPFVSLQSAWYSKLSSTLTSAFVIHVETRLGCGPQSA